MHHMLGITTSAHIGGISSCIAASAVKVKTGSSLFTSQRTAELASEFVIDSLHWPIAIASCTLLKLRAPNAQLSPPFGPTHRPHPNRTAVPESHANVAFTSAAQVLRIAGRTFAPMHHRADLRSG
jgi:hypothetical protein